MSIMFFKVRSVSRAKGQSAVAKSAYINRERLHDERTGKTHDYTRTPGLKHSEIVLPKHTSGDLPDWANDRKTLWNAAEKAEGRKNSRVGREYTIALPHELDEASRLKMAKVYAHLIADRYRCAVDLAVHGPTSRGDQRNHHIHLLTSTRELSKDGFTKKTTIELASYRRKALELQNIRAEFRDLRTHWATLANEHLADAGFDHRLEPRSKAAVARERVKENAAVENHRSQGLELPSSAQRQILDRRAPATSEAEAIERWKSLRASFAASKGHSRPRERTVDRSRGRDSDFDLGL